MSIHKSLVLLVLLFLSCSLDQPTVDRTEKELTDKKNLAVDLKGAEKISVVNYFGGVVINGYAEQDMIEITVSKSIRGEAHDINEDLKDNIHLVVKRTENVVELVVQREKVIMDVDYHISLNLDLPYFIECNLDVQGNVFAAEMDRPIRIRNRGGDTRLVQHNSSCHIQSDFGDVDVDGLMLQPGNTCECTTGKGDIDVAVPPLPAFLEAQFTDEINVDDNLPVNNQKKRFRFYSADIAQGLNFGCRKIILKTENGAVRVSEKYLPPHVLTESPGPPCNSILFVRTNKWKYNTGDTVFVLLRNSAPEPVYLNRTRLTCFDRMPSEQRIFPHTIQTNPNADNPNVWIESDLTQDCETSDDMTGVRKLEPQERHESFRVFDQPGRYRIRVNYATEESASTFPFHVVSNSFAVSGD